MMTCEEVLRELSNFLDEELIPEFRAQVQEHLRLCRNCTVLVNTTRKTLALVADLFVAELPHGVSERLIERLGIH